MTPHRMFDHEQILEGKVAIVTGASRGVGAAAARAVAAAGATVVLAARTEAELAAASRQITTSPTSRARLAS